MSEASEPWHLLGELVARARLVGRVLIARTRARDYEVLLDDAARVLGAEASSLLLHDERAGVLYFAAASGPVSNEIKQLRLRPGEGLAGYVLGTGQALAVTDASQDPRWNRDVAAIGYVPKAMLAVPVVDEGLAGERVLGVIQFLNKSGGFSGQDMAFAGHLARVVAHGLAVDRYAADAARLLAAVVEALGDGSATQQDFATLLATLGLEAELGPGQADAWAIADRLAEASRERPDALRFARDLIDRTFTFAADAQDPRRPARNSAAGGDLVD